MDVCVLGCTPGHIPRYMSQTSNNNSIGLLSCPLWHLYRTPVMDSCYSCFVFLFDLHMICNSDSIRLDIRWHERKVYRWGFPCLDYSFDVLVSWDRDLSVYNQSCLYQLYLDFLFYDAYAIPVHIYFPCVLTLLSSVLDSCTHPWLATWLLHHTRLGSFTDSPGFSCPGPGARSVWISSVVDQSSATVAWFSSYLVSALLYCSFMYIPCIPAFAHISDMIIHVIL